MTAQGTARLKVGACLSLSGQYARFGKQAARALQAWAEWHGAVDLLVENDDSSRRTLESLLPSVVARSDVILGPYSTQLARAAARIAAQDGWLLWNQGGSGDDVESGYPGHCVSILTPTSHYGDPFVDHLADLMSRNAELWIVHAPGSFGRQVAEGTLRHAEALGLRVHAFAVEEFASQPDGEWCLFSAGRFEDDVAIVRSALEVATPPSAICAVAAGVREFADHVDTVDGVYGIAQWFPGTTRTPLIGPSEADFLRAYGNSATASMPDYPAIQAAAGAVMAEHCVAEAGSLDREALWAAAASLDTRTLYGDFKIDPRTGMQAKHATTLLQWRGDRLQSNSV